MFARRTPFVLYVTLLTKEEPPMEIGNYPQPEELIAQLKEAA